MQLSADCSAEAGRPGLFYCKEIGASRSDSSQLKIMPKIGLINIADFFFFSDYRENLGLSQN